MAGGFCAEGGKSRFLLFHDPSAVKGKYLHLIYTAAQALLCLGDTSLNFPGSQKGTFLIVFFSLVRKRTKDIFSRF